MKPEALSLSARLTRGYTIAIIATVLWSSTAIFIRYLNDAYGLPSLVLAFWRDLFLALGLGLVFLIFSRGRLRPGRRNLRFLLLYGLVLSIFNGTWTISVGLNGAAISTVLAYSSAGFTAVIGYLLFKEHLDWIKLLAVFLSLLGCALVSGALNPSAWQVNAVGIITGLVSGLAFAAYSLMGKAAANRQIDAWTTMLYSFGFAALFLLGFNLLDSLVGPAPAQPAAGLFWLGSALPGWIVLLILAVGPTVGGYGLYTVSLRYLPASVANLIATLEPALTAVQAYFLLGERLSPTQWLGSLMILSGVVILRISEGRLAQSRAEASRQPAPLPKE